jgi:hypothetical protein
MRRMMRVLVSIALLCAGGLIVSGPVQALTGEYGEEDQLQAEYDEEKSLDYEEEENQPSEWLLTPEEGGEEMTDSEEGEVDPDEYIEEFREGEIPGYGEDDRS